MNNFELHKAAHDLSVGKTQYQLAREVIELRARLEQMERHGQEPIGYAIKNPDGSFITNSHGQIILSNVKGSAYQSDYESGAVDVPLYIAPPEFDRQPETSRRVAAVEKLLALGWEWNRGVWLMPPAPAVPDGWQLVPKIPTFEMVDGLARALILLSRYSDPSGERLYVHLRISGFKDLPEWLHELIPNEPGTIPKAAMAAAIYRAMLAASPIPPAHQLDKCSTCDGSGLIGGFVNAESGYETENCPECCAPDPRDEQIAELKRRVSVMREALEKLAKLGNGDRYGNSIGNDIARTALEKSHE